MERVNRIAKHLAPTSTADTLVAAPCAGWRILPGPEPGATSIAGFEVADEKVFLAFVEDYWKNRKANGVAVPTGGVGVFKMDSGLYLMYVSFQNDMDFVASQAMVRKGASLGGQKPGADGIKMKYVMTSQQMFMVSYVDERPMTISGQRIALTYFAYKSPAHMARSTQLMNEGANHLALAAEWKKGGVKALSLSKTSDTSTMSMNVLSDEAAFKKDRDSLITKLSDMIGTSGLDFSAAPPEREFGTCIWFKHIEEF